MSELAKAIAEAVTPDDIDSNDNEETKTNYLTKNEQKIEKILDQKNKNQA
jgi:hypothetical protein